MSDIESNEAQTLILTEKLREQLKLKIRSTDISPRALLAKQEDAPEEITYAYLSEILIGNIRVIPLEVYNYLESICQKEIGDEALNTRIKRMKRKNYKPIPKEKIERIKEDIKRTGIWPSVLLRTHNRQDMDIRQIGRILSKEQLKGSIKDIDDLMEMYAQAPDADNAGQKASTIQSAYRGVTDLEIQTIEHHIDRTGVLPTQLPKNMVSRVEFYTIRAWLTKRIKTCIPLDMEEVLSAYRSLASKPTYEDPEEQAEGLIRIKLKLTDINLTGKP